jgi:hypothetical protein
LKGCPTTTVRSGTSVRKRSASPAESAERNDPSYNYGRFEFETHGVPDDRVEAGDHVPDGTVYELDGTARRLEELYTDRPLVLELGSATCPIFTRKCNRMDALATRCDDVRFAVVYAREAHPGANVDAHETFADKLARASSMPELEDSPRAVYADALDGRLHRAFDAMSNSAYLIGIDGVVAHRADWNDPGRLADDIERLLAAGGRGRAVEPADVRNNFEPPSLSFLRELRRVTKRAGTRSRLDLLRSMLTMTIHRLRVRLDRLGQ